MLCKNSFYSFSDITVTYWYCSSCLIITRIINFSILLFQEIMSLIAHLAYNNIGYIDWEPHIPLMFSRFLRSFNLPVQYKQSFSSKKPKIDTNCISYWIVATLVKQLFSFFFIKFSIAVWIYCKNDFTGKKLYKRYIL